MTSKRFDLNAVRVFVAVVDSGGVRKAADELGLTKTSVSRHLAELEERLGVRLVHRTTRAFSVTEAGRELYEQSHEAVRALERAGGHVAELGATTGGVVRLSAPPMLVSSYLGAVVEEVLTRYPDLRVAIDASERHVELLAEGFDLAIRAGALPDSSLTQRRLGSARWRCFGSPSYFGRRGVPRAPGDLAHHDCILHSAQDPDLPERWEFVHEGAPLVVEVSGRVAANSMASVCDLAQRGLGIARLFSFMAEAGGGDHAGLVPVLDDFSALAVPLSVVWLPGEPRAARVEAFLEVLIERLAGAPWSTTEEARPAHPEPSTR
jgi:DNA-binding transcriptional LysR family regulator